METTFHPSLTLVPSLANCSLSLCTLSLTEFPHYTPKLAIPTAHNVGEEGGREGGSVSVQVSILKFILV